MIFFLIKSSNGSSTFRFDPTIFCIVCINFLDLFFFLSKNSIDRQIICFFIPLISSMCFHMMKLNIDHSFEKIHLITICHCFFFLCSPYSGCPIFNSCVIITDINRRASIFQSFIYCKERCFNFSRNIVHRSIFTSSTKIFWFFCIFIKEHNTISGSIVRVTSIYICDSMIFLFHVFFSFRFIFSTYQI